MVIVVVGFPGARVEQTLTNANAAATEFGVQPKVRRVNDVFEISHMGNVATPTLFINGKLKSSGRIPSVFEIASWIEEEFAEEALTSELEEGVAA